MKFKKSIQNTRLKFYRFNRHEISLGFCVNSSRTSNRPFVDWHWSTDHTTQKVKRPWVGFTLASV